MQNGPFRKPEGTVLDAEMAHVEKLQIHFSRVINNMGGGATHLSAT